jgi:hypothetical protein
MRRTVAAIGLVLAGCGGSALTTNDREASGMAGVAAFDEQGIAFDYPASWRAFHYQAISSFSNLIVYLGTVDVPNPCTTDGNTTSCGASFRLAPNSIVVAVSGIGMPGFNILDSHPPGSRALVIGGLPAYVEPQVPSDPGVGADRTMSWTIARPGSVDNAFVIRADIRGPDVDGQAQQVEAVIASVRFDPPVVPLDPGEAAAERAATAALATLARDDPAWACFSGKPGVRQMRISSFVSGPALVEPQVASCTTQIEATRLQLWRLTLTLRLDRPDPTAGSGQRIVLWVNPDGTPGATTSGPL